jgi:predicted dithiol-disulfide oxidoreductase (DUF899 family)
MYEGRQISRIFCPDLAAGVVCTPTPNLIYMEKMMTMPEKSPVVSREVWMDARLRLLAKERELTRMTDKVNDERRSLPRVKMQKPYVFEGQQGKVGLAGLFGSQRKLILQHFMFGPDWAEGCPGCSFGADATLGMLMHLAHHGYAFVAVSRAPLAMIEAFKRRMGWAFNWVSSLGSDFNFDFNVSFSKEDLGKGPVMYNYQPLKLTIDEMPGLSLFEKDEYGEVYHTYSGYGAESEQLVASLCHDLKERGVDGPVYDLGEWVRHHDRYEDRMAASEGRATGLVGAEAAVASGTAMVVAEASEGCCCGNGNSLKGGASS